MCTRYLLLRRPEALAAKLGLVRFPALAPRYNAAPRQRLPIVRHSASGTARAATLARWGFAAGETAAGGARGPLINARGETAAAKPAFREAFLRRRCVVPADGFYEWERTAATPQPWLFTPATDDELLLLGALWQEERNVSPDAQTEDAFAVLTTTPNALVAPLHDRMPVLVPAAALDAWLDPATPLAALARLLEPCDAAQLRARPVHPRLNKVSCDDVSCLEPPPPVARQLQLGLG